MKTAERKQNLKMALIAAAERAVAARGLAGLKARSLAAEVGCAVGAIYNVVCRPRRFGACGELTHTRRA